MRCQDSGPFRGRLGECIEHADAGLSEWLSGVGLRVDHFREEDPDLAAVRRVPAAASRLRCCRPPRNSRTRSRRTVSTWFRFLGSANRSIRV